MTDPIFPCQTVYIKDLAGHHVQFDLERVLLRNIKVDKHYMDNFNLKEKLKSKRFKGLLLSIQQKYGKYCLKETKINVFWTAPDLFFPQKIV